MGRLERAEATHLDSLARESYVLWGGGLSPSGYRSLWDEVGSCGWARKFLCHYVWLDAAGRLLSSAKVYRPLLRRPGGQNRCSVFAAVFTPRAMRGRGHARSMLQALLEESAQRGDGAELLFSDIGTAWYGSFGFRALHADEHRGRLPRAGHRKGWKLRLRAAAPDDLPVFARAHTACSLHRPLAIVRDAEHWEFLWLRSRAYFSRLGDPGVTQRWLVAEFQDAPTGYAITVEGHGEWGVREIGALDGEPATAARILDVASRDAVARGLVHLQAWLPPEVASRIGNWGLRRRPRNASLPMIRLRDTDPQRLPGPEPFFPYQDQF